MGYKCKNCLRIKDTFCSFLNGDVNPNGWACEDIELKGDGYCVDCGEIANIHIISDEKECYCLKCAKKTITKWAKADPKLEIVLKSEQIVKKVD